MNDIILDQIDWLVANNGNSNRLTRQLVGLIGTLADGTLPSDIAQQAQTLSRLVVLQDCFDALLKALVATGSPSMLCQPRSSSEPTEASANSHKSPLAEQIDQVRRQIAECDPINFSQLIAWVMGQARAKKLLRPAGKR